MEREGWREPTLSTKAPRRTEGRRERTRLGSNFVACPRPKEARRTRLDADDIADKETKSRKTDAVADKQTTLRTSKRRGEE